MKAAGLKFESVFAAAEITSGKATTPVPGNGSEPAAPQSQGGRGSGPSPASATNQRKLLLHTDGASSGNPGPSGAGWVIFGVGGVEVDRGSQYLGKATNNVAEYRALLLGLAAARALAPYDLTVRMDSELVVKQMLGKYRVKDAGLQPLHQEARMASSAFPRIRFEYVPRERNQLADKLASAAARGRKSD